MFATENCLSIAGENNYIVVNERYLLEVEAAIRSFELARGFFNIPYLQSDEDLFRLVKSIDEDLDKLLKRLRRVSTLIGDQETEIGTIIKMTYLFMIGHEVGHLLKGIGVHSFTSFVDPNEEEAYGEIIAKTKRHVEQFEKLNFNLPGFANVSSESVIGQESSDTIKYHADPNTERNRDLWFEGRGSQTRSLLKFYATTSIHNQMLRPI